MQNYIHFKTTFIDCDVSYCTGFKKNNSRDKTMGFYENYLKKLIILSKMNRVHWWK